MNFDLKRPCKDCPFRTDIAFYLRPARVEEILHGIIVEHASFPCHKTLDYGDDETLIQGQWHTDKTQQCAGAMILLLKCASPNLPMRLAHMAGWIDLDALDLDAPVFDTKEQMIEHYRAFDGRSHQQRCEANLRSGKGGIATDEPERPLDVSDMGAPA